jgi:hypothetical protein
LDRLAGGGHVDGITVAFAALLAVPHPHNRGAKLATSMIPLLEFLNMAN